MTVTIKQGKKHDGNETYYWSIDIEKYSTVYKLEICPVISDDFCGYPYFEGYYQTTEKAMRAMRGWFNRRGIK